MIDNIVTLSVFDGMSCGQIALKELGYVVKYYSSEIDKKAIEQTQHNFPNTIQLGDVTRWKEWDIDWSAINIFIGGSPCQGFSFAGKQLNFSDPRSALFFVYVEILNHIKKHNPNVKFLLENVNMKREYLRIISEYLGIFPVNINSNLVSAQNRNRWYWSNIKTKDVGLFSELWTDIPQPNDRGILTKDIFQHDDDVDRKYFYSQRMIDWICRHEERKGKELYIYTGEEKFMCLEATMYKKCSSQRFFSVGPGLRYITPTECSRLQTIPEWYEWIVSDTQIYKMLGNGWTIEVIKHIFKYLNNGNDNQDQQNTQ
jgi:DNA-cytosine methyltransferase